MDSHEQLPTTPKENEPQTSDSVREAQLEAKDMSPATNVAQTRESLASTDGIDGSFTTPVPVERSQCLSSQNNFSTMCKLRLSQRAGSIILVSNKLTHCLKNLQHIVLFTSSLRGPLMANKKQH